MVQPRGIARPWPDRRDGRRRGGRGVLHAQHRLTEPSVSQAAAPTGRPLRVAAFTGGLTVAPARFRVRQYIVPLARFGIAMHEHWPHLGAFPPGRQALRPAWLV